VTDAGWISAILTGARPQAVAALLRYFRDLDAAEEAFQEACLRALKAWPRNGPPRDAAAWLIMVGRNAGIDGVRRQARERPLPPEEALSDLPDAETALVEGIDEADYRDDILRLLFICCHPSLRATQQIALALRVVSGVPVPRIARAFLVSEAAMEQRITRAKRTVAAAQVPFETPGAVERGERLGLVAAMIYLLYNEGYTTDVAEHGARAPLCAEAIRLGISDRARDHGAACAAPAPARPRTGTVRCERGRGAAGGAGPQALGPDADRRGPRARRQGGAPSPARPLPGAGGDRSAPCAGGAGGGHRLGRHRATLRGARAEPSPVVTLNRAVAVSKVRGPAAALALIEPLGAALGGYFYFHGARGAFLLELGRDAEARDAFGRAIALANTAAEAAHIRDRIDQLIGDRRVAPATGEA
jgi:RNA polymerase sigma-70 factor, ECF subfamily